MNLNIKQTAIRRAFTLIEMMIVIGIIGILAALTLGISSSVMRNAEIHKTEDVLKLLNMALQEWELERGRPLTFVGSGTPEGSYYDIDANNPPYPMNPYTEFADPDFSSVNAGNISTDTMQGRIEHVFRTLMQSESATLILSKITPDHFDENNRKLAVDAWGTPFGIVFPNRPFQGSGLIEQWALDQSGDFTVRGLEEDGLGSCINLRPYFVSAGPDRTWGYRYQAVTSLGGSVPDTTNWEASLDNVYSYPPFIVEESR
ncbi:MAG: prepilin-type N-terminal cleavage/methylation domain-containing protein [Planctomycetes bacterium]|nr:prepilin-type N-terminal cleavage/methylation domain-containing protein [Planctomycetota bacterium]